MPLPFRKSRSLHFHIMSDLHLEVGHQYAKFHIQPCAPFLVLAGDVGRLNDCDAFRGFLNTQCKQFRKVFLILGNHEFFGVPRAQGLVLAVRLQNEESLKDGLFVMNRKRVDLAGVTILGCTLQSHVPDDAMAIVAQKINDFRHIGEWTVADHNAEHAKDVDWLKKEIRIIRQVEDASQRKILVVTHHAPAVRGTSAPANEGNPWSSAFSTDLLGQHDGSPLDDVQYWVFGHTHYCSESTRGNVRLVSNQRGYVFPNAKAATSVAGKTFKVKLGKLIGDTEKVEPSFDPKKVISI